MADKKILKKKTNYTDTISLTHKQLEDLGNGVYDEIQITVASTNEVIDVNNPSFIVANANKIPRRNRYTGEVRWSSYYVSKFR